MSPYLIAGMFAGIAGLLTFLVIHHFWIQPIWFIAPVGLIVAGLGGLAVGWAYAEIQPGLPPRPMTALAVMGLIALTLLPAIVLGQTRPALVDMSTGSMAIPAGQGGRVAVRVVLELLVTATLMGGLAGGWLGHTSRAAFATALAGFVFALGPGHNIPLLGNTPAAGKGVLLLLAITFVSAFVLVEASAWMLKR